MGVPLYRVSKVFHGPTAAADKRLPRRLLTRYLPAQLMTCRVIGKTRSQTRDLANNIRPRWKQNVFEKVKVNYYTTMCEYMKFFIFFPAYSGILVSRYRWLLKTFGRSSEIVGRVSSIGQLSKFFGNLIRLLALCIFMIYFVNLEARREPNRMLHILSWIKFLIRSTCVVQGLPSFISIHWKSSV